MKKHSGFTLIELVVSMGIGMIILLLAVTSLNSASTGYGRNTDGISAEREARAVLTQIAEDLSKAVWHKDTVVEKGTEPRRRDKIGFLFLQPADAQTEAEHIGDLCATVYYVADLATGGREVRCLMRGFRGSEETFEAIRSDDVASLFDAVESDEPISIGVLSFEVSPLERQEGGGWTDWIDQRTTDSDDPFASAPQGVKLRLVVARRELMAKLRASEDWDQSPLIPKPDLDNESKQVEVYEILHPFS